MPQSKQPLQLPQPPLQSTQPMPTGPPELLSKRHRRCNLMRLVGSLEINKHLVWLGTNRGVLWHRVEQLQRQEEASRLEETPALLLLLSSAAATSHLNQGERMANLTWKRSLAALRSSRPAAA